MLVEAGYWFTSANIFGASAVNLDVFGENQYGFW